ncbi:MAG: tautomerase family protein, partial [Burkholderia sp.]|nr:tautomerase family protein [Burkholderia sp.]
MSANTDALRRPAASPPPGAGRRSSPTLKGKGTAMPSVLIEVRRQYTQEQEIALIEAVHVALRDAFKIMPGDKNV